MIRRRWPWRAALVSLALLALAFTFSFAISLAASLPPCFLVAARQVLGHEILFLVFAHDVMLIPAILFGSRAIPWIFLGIHAEQVVHGAFMALCLCWRC